MPGRRSGVASHGEKFQQVMAAGDQIPLLPSVFQSAQEKVFAGYGSGQRPVPRSLCAWRRPPGPFSFSVSGPSAPAVRHLRGFFPAVRAELVHHAPAGRWQCQRRIVSTANAAVCGGGVPAGEAGEHVTAVLDEVHASAIAAKTLLLLPDALRVVRGRFNRPAMSVNPVLFPRFFGSKFPASKSF